MIHISRMFPMIDPVWMVIAAAIRTMISEIVMIMSAPSNATAGGKQPCCTKYKQDFFHILMLASETSGGRRGLPVQ